ncbi:hypothetical protein BLAT2472_130091 [Burkholderia latens]
MAGTPAHAARDRRPRPHRDGRRQRCRRVRHLYAGRPELRHDAAVDAAAARAGVVREPGNGAAPRCGDGRRPCAADFRTLRQVLGRVQRDRPVPAQRVDDRHRIHRHHVRAGFLRAPEGRGRVRRGRADDGGGEYRRFQALRAVCDRAVRAEPAARAGARVDPSAGVADVARLLRAELACAREAVRRDAARDRHRRYHGCAVAAVLPAKLRDRQAHHAALHEVREGRPVDRHRVRPDRRGRDDRFQRRAVWRSSGSRPLHRRRRRDRGPREVCGPHERDAVRGRAAGRVHHRRGGGVAVHCVRDRRRVQDPSFAASRRVGREGFLSRLLRNRCGCGCARADSGQPAGPADRSGADARRRAAAERDGVPARAVQRPSRAWALGQFDEAQRVYRRGGVGAGAAVDHPDRVRHVSGHQRRSDRRRAGRRHGARDRRLSRDGADPPQQARRRARRRSLAARHVAHAAARVARAAEDDGRDACVDGRAARLSGNRGRSRDRQGRADDAAEVTAIVRDEAAPDPAPRRNTHMPARVAGMCVYAFDGAQRGCGAVVRSARASTSGT